MRSAEDAPGAPDPGAAGPAAADAPRAADPGALTVLAVDDERPALDDLARLLAGSPRVGTVRTAGGADEALALLAAEAVDAVLLDVRMPGLDGVALARVLGRFARPPAVVFVSAYEDAAVEAFAVRAVDYLLKPVGQRRLEEALDRVVATPAAGAGPVPGVPRPATSGPAPAPVGSGPSEAPGGSGAPVGSAGSGAPGGAAATGASGGAASDGAERPDEQVVPVDTARGGTRLVPRGSILYLQAHGDYVRVVADDGRYLLRARLADIERRWTALGFVRVHRGYVVNLRRAVEVRPRLNGTAVLAFADGSEVPVARRQVGELRRRLRGG